MADLRRALKRLVLQCAKRTGAARAARYMTSRGLRILCYHGMSLVDEHEFHGQLFMRPELFRRRMEWLPSHGFRVLSLSEAVDRLYQGTLPDQAVVLTFDDGWYGTYRHALPVLSDLRMPATIYVTTHYVERETAVFNVAVEYLFWRGSREHIDLSVLNRGLEGTYGLKDAAGRKAAGEVVSTYADANLSAEERQALLNELAEYVGVDPDVFQSKRVCGLMTMDEVRLAAAAGFDIQLHTHRHSLSISDRAAVAREIRDNRSALAGRVEGSFTHLAYPSGVWHPQILPWLHELGIDTATTTRRGHNYSDANRLALGRFLDGENIAPIEFEAELDGVLDLFRQLRSMATSGARTRHGSTHAGLEWPPHPPGKN